ncbi:MAG: BrxE family protein [Thermoguttaceae bacterium]
MTETTLNLVRLLQLRLAVARFGEMDRAKWWNTKGVLSDLGEMALSRGFPKSHLFARARIVFAVAASRCREVFDPPKCITLWKLLPTIEDQLGAMWSEWLDAPTQWTDFLVRVNEQKTPGLLDVLSGLELIDDRTVEEAKRLKRSPDGQSVVLSGECDVTDETVALLAAGFHRSEPGKLAVPYARLREGDV